MTTPEESIAAAEKQIDDALPKNSGWTKKFVSPPWRGMAPKCRGCGRDPASAALMQPGLKWANAAIVKHDQSVRIVFYSFGLVCKTCADNKETMNRLAVEIFSDENMNGVDPS